MECFSLKFVRKNARKLLLLKFSVYQFPKKLCYEKFTKNRSKGILQMRIMEYNIRGEAFERICSIKMAEK